MIEKLSNHKNNPGESEFPKEFFTFFDPKQKQLFLDKYREIVTLKFNKAKDYDDLSIIKNRVINAKFDKIRLVTDAVNQQLSSLLVLISDPKTRTIENTEEFGTFIDLNSQLLQLSTSMLDIILEASNSRFNEIKKTRITSITDKLKKV